MYTLSQSLFHSHTHSYTHTHTHMPAHTHTHMCTQMLSLQSSLGAYTLSPCKEDLNMKLKECGHPGVCVCERESVCVCVSMHMCMCVYTRRLQPRAHLCVQSGREMFFFLKLPSVLFCLGNGRTERQERESESEREREKEREMWAEMCHYGMDLVQVCISGRCC